MEELNMRKWQKRVVEKRRVVDGEREERRGEGWAGEGLLYAAGRGARLPARSQITQITARQLPP